MAISRDEFKRAFREVISFEFSNIPSDESLIDIKLSETFIRKMEKLIKSQKKSYYVLINTAAKRVAVIVVAILTLFTASLSVEAIRKPVIEFIVEIYEDFIQYFFDGDTADSIEKEYTITELPEGFVLKDKIVTETLITTIYENDLGQFIELNQMIMNHTETNIDNEYTIIKSEQDNGLEISVWEWDVMKQMMWNKENYSFNIICDKNIANDTIFKMIDSIE